MLGRNSPWEVAHLNIKTQGNSWVFYWMKSLELTLNVFYTWWVKTIREYLAEYFDDITVQRPDVIEMMLESNNFPFTQFGRIITDNSTKYINWVVENFYDDVIFVNRRLYYSSSDILVLIKLSLPVELHI